MIRKASKCPSRLISLLNTIQQYQVVPYEFEVNFDIFSIGSLFLLSDKELYEESTKIQPKSRPRSKTDGYIDSIKSNLVQQKNRVRKSIHSSLFRTDHESSNGEDQIYVINFDKTSKSEKELLEMLALALGSSNNI